MQPQENQNEVKNEAPSTEPMVQAPIVPGRKKPNKIIIILGLLILIVVIALAVFWVIDKSKNQGDTPADKVTENGLQATLTSDKTEYDAGDTIKFKLVVKNNTSETYEWQGSSSCQGDDLINVETNESIYSSGRVCTQDIAEFSIDPGEKSEDYEFLVQGSSLGDGCHEFKGMLNDIESNIVKVCANFSEATKKAQSECRASKDFAKECTQVFVMLDPDTSLNEANEILKKHGLVVIEQLQNNGCTAYYNGPCTPNPPRPSYDESLGFFYANVPLAEKDSIKTQLESDSKIITFEIRALDSESFNL